MPSDDSSAETMNRGELAVLQRRKLADLFARILVSNEFYRPRFPIGLADPGAIRLEDCPFTSRAEIEEDQRRNAPFGSNLSFQFSYYTRYHQTSGTAGLPIRWLDTPESWDWCKRCWGVVFRAGGVHSGDRMFFPFSFGPFLGFWAAFDSAAERGHLCFPAGGMTSVARLRFLNETGATVICCTPTYAMRLAEAAEAERMDLSQSSVRLVIVAGEPGGNVPAVRTRLETAFGARVLDHAGMTETGPWGFECLERPGGMHVIESEYIAEIVDPDSGQAVPDGQPGELVLTNLGRVGSPLLRYRTGDIVQGSTDRCACGRWWRWLEGGIRGRADDMMVIRGNNVFPSAIENVVRSFPEIVEFRLCAERTSLGTELRIEVESQPSGPTPGLTNRLAAAVRDQLHFRPMVSLVAPGSLPRYEMKAKRLITQSHSVQATRKDEPAQH